MPKCQNSNVTLFLQAMDILLQRQLLLKSWRYFTLFWASPWQFYAGLTLETLWLTPSDSVIGGFVATFAPKSPKRRKNGTSAAAHGRPLCATPRGAPAQYAGQFVLIGQLTLILTVWFRTPFPSKKDFTMELDIITKFQLCNRILLGLQNGLCRSLCICNSLQLQLQVNKIWKVNRDPKVKLLHNRMTHPILSVRPRSK